jgi:hypothetical protein
MPQAGSFNSLFSYTRCGKDVTFLKSCVIIGGRHNPIFITLILTIQKIEKPERFTGKLIASITSNEQTHQKDRYFKYFFPPWFKPTASAIVL